MKGKDFFKTLTDEGKALSRLVEETIQHQSEDILKAIEMVRKSIKKGGKILLFGNGGSAADAVHIAGEFSGTFSKKEEGIPAIALTSNLSSLTALANDRGYQFVFSAQIEALGKKRDVAWGLTTSGRSINVLEGLKKAKKLGLQTLCMCGNYIELVDFCDVVLSVPSSSTQRIQEVHLFLGHTIWKAVKDAL